MPVEIRVPPLDAWGVKATVGRWMKGEGQSVARDETLVELETDTTVIELVAPHAGVLTRIVRGEGETVRGNDLLAELSERADVPGDLDEARAGAPILDQIRVPSLVDWGMVATVGRWMKQQGQPVARDETLVELETDTTIIELVAPRAGILTRIVRGEGETVRGSDLLAEVGEDARAADSKA